MTSHLLSYYEAIESYSQQMLQAAEEAQWDELVKVERACATLIGLIQTESKQASLSASERSAKAKVMMRILRNDARIREILEPNLAEIDSRYLTPKTLH